MNSLYFPNLYRVDQFRKNEMNTQIGYYQSEMKGEVYKAYKVGVTYRLLEQLLFYDRIYVDIIELPILLSVLDWIDSDFMKEIVKQGFISYVNCYDMSIGVSYNKSQYFGALAVGKGKYSLINSVDELRSFVFERFTYNKNIDTILEKLFDNSIDYINDDFKKLVKDIDRDIKDKDIRGKIGINSSSGTLILKRDVPIINALSYAARNLLVSEKIGVKNLYSEDIILDVLEARYNRKIPNEAYKFNQLLKNYQIPDVELLLFFNKMKAEDILTIRESKDFQLINKRVLQEAQNDTDILEIFMNATNNRIKKNDLSIKFVSLVTSNLLGLVHPLAGIASSTLSEIISTLKSNQGHPTLALEKISKMIMHSSKEFNDLPNIVTTRVKRQYIVK